MRTSSLFGAVAVTAMLGFAVLPALASEGGGGGGGGGGFSGGGGSQIDVAKTFQEGVALMQASDFKGADSKFSKVLSVIPKDGAANYLMGRAKLGQNKPQDARKYLRNAVKYKPDMPDYKGYLGVVEYQTGDAAKANEQKAALADMKTKCAGTCPQAAIIDASIKLIDDAMAKPQSSSIDPTYGLKQLASVDDGAKAYLSAHELVNEGRYQEALVVLDKAELAVGPHPDVLTYMGFANRKLHNYETAIAYYSVALKLNPNHKGANEYLGEYYVETHQMDKAKAQLAKLDKICAFGCEEQEELRRWISAGKS